VLLNRIAERKRQAWCDSPAIIAAPVCLVRKSDESPETDIALLNTDYSERMVSGEVISANGLARKAVRLRLEDPRSREVIALSSDPHFIAKRALLNRHPWTFP
jgi:hypothetical protein